MSLFNSPPGHLLILLTMLLGFMALTWLRPEYATYVHETFGALMLALTAQSRSN